MVASSKNILILFSGGQDSATCALWARDHFDDDVRFHYIRIDYGQRHSVELEVGSLFLRKMYPEFGAKYDAWCAVMKTVYKERIREEPKMPEPPYTEAVLQMRLPIGKDTDRALLEHDLEIKEEGRGGLPNTFVPGRNLLFLAHAVSYAAAHDCSHIITGVCETDFSGYPDCREQFIQSMEATANLALEGYTKIKIITPLMHINKATTFEMAELLGALDLIVEHTHTCYKGDRSNRFSWGYGCGKCPACIIRKNGWEEFTQHIEG